MRWLKNASREKVHPVWDTRKAVAANLDARVARTGPGWSVSRSLLVVKAWHGSKERDLSRRNERVENPPPQTVKVPVPQATNDSGKRAASPTVRHGEVFEVVILSEPRQREKTTRVGEALREFGLDEGALARTYTKLLQKLLESAEGNSNDKLTLEVLKELGRILEPTGSANAGPSFESDATTVVQLVHDIPRPSRFTNAGLGAEQ